MRMVCHENTGSNKFIKRFISGSGLVISLFLIFNSCAKDPDSLGRDLLPSSDNIYVRIDSSTVINSYSITGKQLLTSASDFYVLGSMKDSIFGYGSASLLTQFHPKYLSSADSLRRVDSLVLYLSTAGAYGDTLQSMTLRIYEVNQKKLKLDTTYYSDIDPAEYCSMATELASSTFTTVDSIIRVVITDPVFIDKFENMPDSVFKDKADFDEQFYGLYLKVDQVSEGGGYAYFNLSNANTRLTLYYNGDHNGDTISDGYLMGFTSYAAKANVLSHDYAGFPVAANLNLPGAGDTLMYVEGIAGTCGRISFPYLNDWKSKGRISINKAELILPVDSVYFPSLSVEDYPPQLILYTISDDEEYGFLYDDVVDPTNGNTYFDGNYDKLKNAYVFNIGLHLQSFMRSDTTLKDPINTDLVIISRQSKITANRVILKGSTSVNLPIKLKVTYTELF